MGKSGITQQLTKAVKKKKKEGKHNAPVYKWDYKGHAEKQAANGILQEKGTLKIKNKNERGKKKKKRAKKKKPLKPP